MSDERWSKEHEILGGDPEAMPKEIAALRATITQQAQDLEKLKGVLGANEVLVERLASATMESEQAKEVESVLRDYNQFRYEPKKGLAHLACSVRDVCDDLKIALREKEVLQQQLAAMTTRFTETAKSFNEAIKREASALQQLAAMTTERDNWETSADETMKELKEARQQLAASQARCRELEEKLNQSQEDF